MSLDDLSLVSSIASLVLAILAIWLSIKLFQMSESSAKDTTDAAKGIASSVERLEKLFDRMYSDTFGMMRDTVSDMRKHMWPAQDVETDVEETDAKIAALREQVTTEINGMIGRIGATDERIGTIRSEMDAVVQRAISESRLVDTRPEERVTRTTVLDAIITLSRHEAVVTLDDVVSLFRRRGVSLAPVLSRIRELHRIGMIETDDGSLAPRSVIKIANPSARDQARSSPMPESGS